VKGKERDADIHLRRPFYDRDLLEKLMVKAGILRMNEEEFRLVCDMFDMGGHERAHSPPAADLRA
jgi:hypothetical protein